ncbi:MAG: hypothetical protein MZW92_66195 [Comamonadaceae bacterium]|nr:hypothetical protein [Comamonadaceae bacterium]
MRPAGQGEVRGRRRPARHAARPHGEGASPLMHGRTDAPRCCCAATTR